MIKTYVGKRKRLNNLNKIGPPSWEGFLFIPPF